MTRKTLSTKVLVRWHNHCTISDFKFNLCENVTLISVILLLLTKEVFMFKKFILVLGTSMFLLSGIFATAFTPEAASLEIIPTATPTVSPSASPTTRPSLLDKPTPSPTPSPTVSPSPLPNPTMSPNPNPSPTGEPTPIPNPTGSPTPLPSPSETPLPTPDPSVSPTP